MVRLSQLRMLPLHSCLALFHIGNWHTVSFQREKTLLVSRFNKKCRLNEPVRQTKEMRDVIK